MSVEDRNLFVGDVVELFTRVDDKIRPDGDGVRLFCDLVHSQSLCIAFHCGLILER